MSNKLILFTFFFLLKISVSYSQDAFFTQFFNKESFYNPAMTGINNSTSYRISHKSQWNGQGHIAYKSLLMSMEDAMPCSNLDWGVYALGDREGSSTFSTYKIGAKMAYSLTNLIPYFNKKRNLFSQHNIRMGMDWSIGQHRIDYSRLVFSDQIDQKYGVVLPTSFTPPDGTKSALFFTPGFGLVWQAQWNKGKRKSVVTKLGSSVSNSFAFGGESVGQSSSILGVPNIYKQIRYTFFLELDFLPYFKKNLYINTSPLFFYQRQGGIDYWEIGTSVDISSIVQTGIYFHNTGF
ncbi:MAG: type IX secretion system membrane protein PorP/SprF, partial [Saprospiraceae bacterium]